MCTYCSTGDLHALWRAAGRFAEATVRLFAAELVLVLGEYWGGLSPPGGGSRPLGATGVAEGTAWGGDPRH